MVVMVCVAPHLDREGGEYVGDVHEAHHGGGDALRARVHHHVRRVVQETEQPKGKQVATTKPERCRVAMLLRCATATAAATTRGALGRLDCLHLEGRDTHGGWRIVEVDDILLLVQVSVLGHRLSSLESLGIES